MSVLENLPSKFSLVVTPQKDPDGMRVGNAFLSKPDGWPAVMIWPPKRVRDAVKRGQITEDNAHKFQDYYNKYAQLSKRHAEKFEQHLKDHAVPTEDSRRLLMFRMKKRLGYDNTRNHNHIAWAFILDPNGDFRGAYDQSIASMGRTTLTTLDGGRIAASEKSIRVMRNSEMTAQVLVEEALARGWTHINIEGGPVMVAKVMQQAKARGLEVNGIIRRAPWGLKTPFDKKVFTMETMGIDKESFEELADLQKKLADDTSAKPRKPDVQVKDAGPEDPNNGMV